MCQKCGCNTCETKSTALILNESKAPRAILSEGLKHHIDTNKPLTEHLYRAGSRAYFDLFAEARSLYSRGILEFTHEDDVALLTETNLGHFGMFEGKKVPLDFPMLDEEVINENNLLKQAKLSSEEYQKAKKLKDFNADDYEWNSTESLYVKEKKSKFKKHGEMSGFDMRGIDEEESLKERIVNILEAKAKKKDNRPIGKPMRDTSGGKAYKVYVKDPKTKKVKTVRFGSGGLRAKINDSKARAAFAARHKCSTKKDRTKAGYWSCRLPRYAKLLGLKSSFSGFW